MVTVMVDMMVRFLDGLFYDAVIKYVDYTACPQSPFGVLKNCGEQTN
jgi:hypothetical protein